MQANPVRGSVPNTCMIRKPPFPVGCLGVVAWLIRAVGETPTSRAMAMTIVFFIALPERCFYSCAVARGTAGLGRGSFR